jgi:hypothetical protein
MTQVVTNSDILNSTEEELSTSLENVVNSVVDMKNTGQSEYNFKEL